MLFYVIFKYSSVHFHLFQNNFHYIFVFAAESSNIFVHVCHSVGSSSDSFRPVFCLTCLPFRRHNCEIFRRFVYVFSSFCDEVHLQVFS